MKKLILTTIIALTGIFLTAQEQVMFPGQAASSMISNANTKWQQHTDSIKNAHDSIAAHRGLIDLNFSWIYDIMNDSLPAIRTDIEAGGGTIALYSNSTPVEENLGGISIGETFNEVSYSDMFDALLYPYQVPSFSSFSISGQSSTLECGVEIASGVKTWSWATSNPSNITANSIDIDDVTTTTNLITGTGDDGSQSVSIGASAITKTTTATQHRWRITGENTQSTNFTRDFVVTWYSPFYYGEGSASLSVASIQGLTKSVSSRSSKTYTFNPTSEVMYIAYPASYGSLSSIIDPNGFETIADWTLRVVSFTNNPTSYYGATVSYNVYEFNNLTTQTSYSYTFNF